MNFIDQESAQKLRGGYYTPPDIAAFLSRWVLASSPQALLEPSSGDGVFVQAVLDRRPEGLKRLVACELDPLEAAKTRLRITDPPRGVSAEVWCGDFLAWAIDHLEFTGARDSEGSFDGVLGNPPFIRYQYLDPTIQARAEHLIRELGLRFTKHTNAWVPFVIASIALLRPGGRLGMVVPSELLHVLHAQSAREFLIRECKQVLILDPEEIWFEETLQGVVLLLAEKKPSGADHEGGRIAIQPVSGRAFLGSNPGAMAEKAQYVPSSLLGGKWTVALLSDGERTLIQDLEERSAIRKFADLAEVAVGIVTGANRFFLVPDAIVRSYGLDEFALPMFGRSDHVPGVVYDKNVHEKNRRSGVPVNFIYFNGTSRASMPEGARRYVEEGEAQGLHLRYKCRIRDPWFSVPSVFSTSVAMLKRSHDYPRLILNSAGAYTTDTAYRVRPRLMEPSHLVWSFVNSLTALTAELEGRHYGGGVLELVPSEIRKLLIPVAAFQESDLLALESRVRAGGNPEEVIAHQDAVVLKRLGVGKESIESISHARFKLRNRRHRTSSAETTLT